MNTSDTATTLDENRVTIRSCQCFVMAGGVWSTYCDHALQSRRKLADFCEKTEKPIRTCFIGLLKSHHLELKIIIKYYEIYSLQILIVDAIDFL
jgi:hypothetical protein